MYSGDGCGAVPAGSGSDVAVLDAGTCPLQQKIEALQAAGGYSGAILSFCDDCELTESAFALERNTLPVFAAPQEFARSAFGAGADAAPAVGTRGEEVTLTSFFDGWGYVHLYDAVPGSDGKLRELDTFAVPEAMDPAFADEFGALSVHEVATSPTRSDLAYLAYYGAGFRVIELRDGKIVEVGRALDRTGPEGNDFWGVQVFDSGGQELVAASDRNFGLYVFRYTGE